MIQKGSILFDLDGTLAKYNGWMGYDQIGEPVLPMVNLATAYINMGYTVKIFTARVASTNPDRLEALVYINEWCRKVFGRELEVTAEKDFSCIRLYDDRAMQVTLNEGLIYEDTLRWYANKERYHINHPKHDLSEQEEIIDDGGQYARDTLGNKL